MSKPPDRAPPKIVASGSASIIAIAHTFLSISAFLAALGIGTWLHYHKIVKNEHWGYPDEWFPSVSATIGDWAPERHVFQILIALTSGPRLLLVLVSYLLSRAQGKSLAAFVAICGVVRTLCCGGWVFIPSWEGGEVHDAFMIGYIVSNIPWMLGTRALLSPRSTSWTRRLRGHAATGFFGSLVPLVYFYIQHKVHRVAGAYSTYALFEWSLIALDVGFDSIAVKDFAELDFQIVQAPPESDPRGARIYLDPYVFRTTPSVAPAATEKLARPEQAPAWWRGFGVWCASWLHFAADFFMAFVFWSNLTALGPMIFYQSVWSMGLSGDEVLLFCTLSPIFLLSSSIQNFVSSHPVVVAIVELGGIAAYKIDDEGEQRLRTLSFVLAVGVLGWCAKWRVASSAADRGATDRLSSIFLLGLLLSVLVKHASYSINPVWPFMSDFDGGHMENGGINGFALKLGALAILDLAFRSDDSYSDTGAAAANDSAPSSADSRRPTPSATPTSTLAAYGFGAVLFLLHFLYTDAGTIIAWSQKGYPLSAPTAMPHGVLTIVALAVGLLLPLQPSLTPLILSPTLLPVVYSFAYFLLQKKGWVGFTAGALLGTYTLAIFPSLLRATAQLGPAGFFRSFATYNIFVLASVWTVAYAFVPGGVYLREKTDIILGGVMLLLGLAILDLYGRRDVSVAGKKESQGSDGRLGRLANKLRIATTLVVVLSGAVAYGRRRMEEPTPYHAEARLVTAAIWTMHFGLDGRMWESQRRMANIIREAEIDIIGLLESDLQRIVMGNRDMTQYISSTLNMYSDIGPSPSSHTWGCALLSKFPIVNSTHLLLPSPAGELAPAIHATLDIYGEMVDVVVAHNGQEEDARDRELQSIELARVMREAWPRPVIFLGYVVTKPGDVRPAPYQILTEDGRVHDVDPFDTDRWCQYILFRGLHRVAYARLNRGSNPSITDTELQLAKFVVPEHDAVEAQSNATETIPLTRRKASLEVDLTKAARIEEKYVEGEHRFDPMFYGDGVRGHRFQILQDRQGFYSPVYYVEGREAGRRVLEVDFPDQGCQTQ